MNQPELGTKIAELRKNKGLTQEDLVAKCNINVRTLQRIEAGEVMPRKYTLDLLFEALEYSIDDSKTVDSPKWLEQVYLYIIDSLLQYPHKKFLYHILTTVSSNKFRS